MTIADGAKQIIGTAMKERAVFRVIEYAPGVTPRNHRTDSIDFAVVMSGEIDMELDDEVVRLKAGDVMVQRGTIHNWVNNGRQALCHCLCADRRGAGPGAEGARLDFLF